MKEAVEHQRDDDGAEGGEIEPAEADRGNPAELADVAAHFISAERYRGDDQRDDDHPDRLDKGGADRLQRRGKTRPDQRQDQPDHQPGKHLQRQGEAESACSGGCAVHRRPSHTVAMALAGEPTAPGRRKGGAVNRKRERPLARSQSAKSDKSQISPR